MFCNKQIVGGGRNTSIELLRLVSMVMVVNLHTIFYTELDDSLWQIVDFLRKSLSLCAVDTFLIITGFFGIKWKLKSAFNILFQLLFYSFGAYLVFIYLNLIDYSSSKEIIKTCLLGAFKFWGFMTGYLVVYAVSPLLNYISQRFSQNLWVPIIFLFMIDMLFYPNSGGSLLNYCNMYFIGRSIRQRSLGEQLKHPVYGYIFFSFLILISSYSLYYWNNKDSSFIETFIFGFSYASPFCIMQAVFLFLSFYKLRISSNSINWLASSCLSVYLIHMHPLIKPYWRDCAHSLYELSAGMHICLTIGLIITTFIGSIIIDRFRKIISNYIYNGIDKSVSFIIRKAN